MPLPLIALAATQAAIGIGQSISAGAKRRRAKREFDPYEIAASERERVRVAGGIASQREIPGADIIRERVRGATGRGVEAATGVAESSSDVLGVLAGLYGREGEVEKDIGIASAENYQRNQRVYMEALGRMGQLETEKWKYNELYPYVQGMGESAQLEAAGGANIGSAIKSGVSIYGGQQELSQADIAHEQWMSERFGPQRIESRSPIRPMERSSELYWGQ
jgi:hypothetical protein